MKKGGIFLVLIGLMFTVFATLRLLVEEHVTDPGKTERAQIQIHHQIWEPLLGAMVVIAGAGIYMVGKSRQVKSHVNHSIG